MEGKGEGKEGQVKREEKGKNRKGKKKGGEEVEETRGEGICQTSVKLLATRLK